ncbi:cytochrome c biogenesis protein CcsA [Ignavibacteria bacterium]|nr:cytochrome c biogenesis protein CcsA [Bacteroidota bacterium]MCZ2132822.1 cytochrome c biogenesis protein CcsA [Bacteroidota bacterium]
MLSQFLIHLLFAGSIIMTGSYFLALRGRTDLLGAARNIYRGVAIGLVVAMALLMANVIGHNFDYTYVWRYSSRDLGAWFLFASGYAGQEGSILLWTTWVGVIGIALMPYLQRRNLEAEVMCVYSLALIFMTLLLVVKNPFEYYWDSFAANGLIAGMVPPDGRGLNPLLQNIWITIHPPILFTGFAAMTVPFAFAIAALIRRDYQSWIAVALPWTLYATAILGFGIMLGGFWAYETLGWGGFWAWDPVENSSLIPWLTAVALVHTMLVQKRTGGLVKTNVILAMLSFILVLYSTFLTRSGVLGDTSVHSFVDPGMFAFVLLIAFMAAFAVLGIGMLIYRRKDIAAAAGNFSPASREFAMAIGSALVLASAILVFIGTSWPLIAEIAGLPKVAIESSFYNDTHLPLVIAVMLVNGFSLLLRWKAKTFDGVWKSLIFPGSLAVVATAATAYIGMRDIVFLLLGFSSWFALFANVEIALGIIRSKFTSTGAYVSHAGVALLMLGIMATSRYSIIEHATLTKGHTADILGYKITYLGREQVEKEYKDREKYRFSVKVQRNNTETVVYPIMYFSDFNQRQSPFLEPGIHWAATNDVYISPKTVEVLDGTPMRTVKKGETAVFPTDTTMRLEFISFDMSSMRSATGSNGTIRPAAVVRILRGNNADTMTLYSTLDMKTMESIPDPITVPGTSQQISFLKILPNRENLSESQANFGFTDTSKPIPAPLEIFTVEVMIKPYISLVWAGVVAMVGGFFISIVRYAMQSKRAAMRRQETEALMIKNTATATAE